MGLVEARVELLDEGRDGRLGVDEEVAVEELLPGLVLVGGDFLLLVLGVELALDWGIARHACTCLGVLRLEDGVAREVDFLEVAVLAVEGQRLVVRVVLRLQQLVEGEREEVGLVVHLAAVQALLPPVQLLRPPRVLAQQDLHVVLRLDRDVQPQRHDLLLLVEEHRGLLLEVLAFVPLP